MLRLPVKNGQINDKNKYDRVLSLILCILWLYTLNDVMAMSIQPKMWLKITKNDAKSIENWVVSFGKTQPNLRWKCNK